jgi:DNA-directed RNA polymerase subunit RPC12/RpoP
MVVIKGVIYDFWWGIVKELKLKTDLTLIILNFIVLNIELIHFHFINQGGTMTAYTCKSCGKISDEGGHLCDPTEKGDIFSCESCGQQAKKKQHLCKPQVAKFEFFCGGCGRGAVKEGDVCDPQPMK